MSAVGGNRTKMIAPYIRTCSAEVKNADEQRKAIAKFIANRFPEYQGPIVRTYEDYGYNGFSYTPGPALGCLIENTRSGDIGSVVVVRPDRLSRRLWIVYEIFELLLSRGVSIYAVSNHGLALHEVIPREHFARTAAFAKRVDGAIEQGREVAAGLVRGVWR